MSVLARVPIMDLYSVWWRKSKRGPPIEPLGAVKWSFDSKVISLDCNDIVVAHEVIIPEHNTEVITSVQKISALIRKEGCSIYLPADASKAVVPVTVLVKLPSLQSCVLAILISYERIQIHADGRSDCRSGIFGCHIHVCIGHWEIDGG